MLKRVLFVSLFLIACASKLVHAEVIMARLLAESFVTERVGEPRLGEVISLSEQGSSLYLADATDVTKTNVYAYNTIVDEKECFVLMAQNNADMKVIGYGLGQHIDGDNMPIAMTEWLSDYVAAMTNARGVRRSNVPSQAVAPLLSTHWHQHAPFNNLCPTYDEYRTVAGCTAIALSQVLHYYKSDNTAPYRMEYLNEPTMTEISVDYSKGGYDWDNMLLEYSDGAYTEEQGNAVARLVYEAGVACRANYGFEDKYNYTVSDFSTSAPLPFVALQRYFDYNCEIYLRENIPTAMWYDIINKDLIEGRPIIYAGSNSSDGHAFVVDGVDAQGYYHINWGWGGLYDGYFDINYCQADGENEYCKNQYMIAGIAPRTADDEPYKEQLFLAGVGSASSWTCLTTNCYYDAEGSFLTSSDDIGYAVLNDDNEIIYSYFATVYYISDFFYPKYSPKSFHSSAKLNYLKDLKLEDGTYRILPIVGDEYGDKSQWKLVYCPDVLLVTLEVKDGEFTFHNLWEKDGTHEVRDMYAASDVYNGSYFYMGLKLFNNTPYDPNEILPGRLYFENIETLVQYNIDKNIYYTLSYPGIEDEQIIRVRPTNSNEMTMPEGTYRIACDLPEDVIFTDEFLLEVTAKPNYPVLDYANNYKPKQILPLYNYYQNSATQFDVSGIYSANVVGGNVSFNIYATPVEGGEEIYLFSIPDVKINANSDNNSTYQLPNNFYPLCGEYYLSCRYLTPDGERAMLNPKVEWQSYLIMDPTEALLPLTVAQQDLNVRNDAVSIQGRQRVWVDVTNNETADFTGYIRATFIDKSQGVMVEGESELVTIKAGETQEIPVIVTFDKVGNYDVYLVSMRDAAVYAANICDATPITDERGKRFVSSVKVGETVIDGVVCDKDVQVVAIYDIAGNRLPQMEKGVNIVVLSDGSARKIVKR